MKILRRLIPYARPLHHFLPEYIVYTIFGILFGLLNVSLLIPVLQLLFDKTAPEMPAKPEFSFSFDFLKDYFNYQFNHIIQDQGKFQALLFVCAIIAVSIMLANLFRYLAVRVMLRLRLKVLEGIRRDIYHTYLKQSLSYHHNQSKGELLTVMTSEVQEVESSVLNTLQIVLRDPFMVIAYFIALFYFSPTLTLFTLLFLPITGIVITLLTRKLKKLNYFSQEFLSRILSMTDESISGIKQIQSFVAQKLMLEKFGETNRAFSVHSKNLFGKKELASPISEVLGVFAALTLVGFAGYLILNNRSDLTGEQFLTYLIMYLQIIQPLKNLSQVSSTLQRGVVACEKIFSVVDLPVTIENPKEPVAKKDFQQHIHIDSITFRYEQKDILKKVDLFIEKGKTVALVGQSGSGKSTLVDLVVRFYDVQEGAIRIDGTDIRQLALEDLRSLIGTVSQDTFLFNDTIYNNIVFGNPNVSPEQVYEAARIANAHDFILQMENGYDTINGERGVKLSGGQRQRISIARAVLKNAPILILDEATSALDTESEKLVQQALNNLLSNRTSIIIAHRLSTVRHADEIVVLHEGEIRERGTHDELIQRNGYYKRLLDMQEVK